MHGEDSDGLHGRGAERVAGPAGQRQRRRRVGSGERELVRARQRLARRRAQPATRHVRQELALQTLSLDNPQLTAAYVHILGAQLATIFL